MPLRTSHSGTLIPQWWTWVMMQSQDRRQGRHARLDRGSCKGRSLLPNIPPAGCHSTAYQRIPSSNLNLGIAARACPPSHSSGGSQTLRGAPGAPRPTPGVLSHHFRGGAQACAFAAQPRLRPVDPALESCCLTASEDPIDVGPRVGV